MAWGERLGGITIDELVATMKRINPRRFLVLCHPDTTDEQLRTIAGLPEVASVRRSLLIPEGHAIVIHEGTLDELSRRPLAEARKPRTGW